MKEKEIPINIIFTVFRHKDYISRRKKDSYSWSLWKFLETLRLESLAVDVEAPCNPRVKTVKLPLFSFVRSL